MPWRQRLLCSHSCPQCLGQCLPQRRHLTYTSWMNEQKKGRMVHHAFRQINLIQAKELFPVLNPLILFFSTIPFPQTTVAVLFVQESASWSIFLLPEISRSYFLNFSPEACMLATMANTIPHVTKHQCYFLLHLLPHSHIQLHCQISFVYLRPISNPSTPTANAPIHILIISSLA